MGDFIFWLALFGFWLALFGLIVCLMFQGEIGALIKALAARIKRNK